MARTIAILGGTGPEGSGLAKRWRARRAHRHRLPRSVAREKKRHSNSVRPAVTLPDRRSGKTPPLQPSANGYSHAPFFRPSHRS